MRTRLFLALAFAAAIVWTNTAAQDNIAHGVSVVVLDAGHGGSDPGACYAGVREKDLTLNIVLKLGALIEEQMPGVKVVYTRKTDKSLGRTKAEDLQARADIANRAGGDIFVSVHVNAVPQSSVKGAETLIMGETPKEQNYNRNALFDNNRDDLIDMSDERTAAIVRAYIQNMQFTYGEYSMTMARCLQENYRKSGRSVRTIRPQLLYVLYATDMPGVLTEIGFLSNAQEAAYMKSEKGQNEIARNLLASLEDYSSFVLGTRLAEEPLVAEVTPKAEEKKPAAEPVAKPAEKPAVKPEPKPEPAAKPEQKPEPKPAAKPEQKPEPKPAAKPEEKPAPKPAAKPEEKPAPKPEPKPAGKPTEAPLRYAVQVIASSQPVPPSSPFFKSYKGKTKQYLGEGTYRYKYCVGETSDPDAAQLQLKQVRKVFPQAFVVKCRAGKIVK